MLVTASSRQRLSTARNVQTHALQQIQASVFGLWGEPELLRKENKGRGRATANPALSDDEEDMTLSKLNASRRKAAPGRVDNSNSAATPVPEKPPLPQQVVPGVPQAHGLDLLKAFENIRDHVFDQVDSNGELVILSNEKLEKRLETLRGAKDRNKAGLFRIAREAIGSELVKAGLPPLPEM